MQVLCSSFEKNRNTIRKWGLQPLEKPNKKIRVGLLGESLFFSIHVLLDSRLTVCVALQQPCLVPFFERKTGGLQLSQYLLLLLRRLESRLHRLDTVVVVAAAKETARLRAIA